MSNREKKSRLKPAVCSSRGEGGLAAEEQGNQVEGFQPGTSSPSGLFASQVQVRWIQQGCNQFNARNRGRDTPRFVFASEHSHRATEPGFRVLRDGHWLLVRDEASETDPRTCRLFHSTWGKYFPPVSPHQLSLPS